MANKDVRLFGTIPMNGIPVSADHIWKKKEKPCRFGNLMACQLCGRGDDLSLVKNEKGWAILHSKNHGKCPRDLDKHYPTPEEAYLAWNDHDYKLY